MLMKVICLNVINASSNKRKQLRNNVWLHFDYILNDIHSYTTAILFHYHSQRYSFAVWLLIKRADNVYCHKQPHRLSVLQIEYMHNRVPLVDHFRHFELGFLSITLKCMKQIFVMVM